MNGSRFIDKVHIAAIIPNKMNKKMMEASVKLNETKL